MVTKAKPQGFTAPTVMKAKAPAIAKPADTKSAKVAGMRGGMSNVKKTGRTPKV